MRRFLLLPFLLLSFYCHADNVEYHIIPLSDAGENFDLSMIRPALGPNAIGQFVTYDSKLNYTQYSEIYFNDPVNGKVLLNKLGDLPSFINDSGDVVGDHAGVGYIWSNENGYRDIQPLHTFSYPTAVNNLGDVIFIDLIKSSYWENEYVTCLVTNDNKKFCIHKRYVSFIIGKALNDSRQIVGKYVAPDQYAEPPTDHAFIWDENAGLRELKKLIPQDSGWEDLVEAKYINNDGLIVGDGIYQGQPTQFLLIPGS